MVHSALASSAEAEELDRAKRVLDQGGALYGFSTSAAEELARFARRHGWIEGTRLDRASHADAARVLGLVVIRSGGRYFYRTEQDACVIANVSAFYKSDLGSADICWVTGVSLDWRLAGLFRQNQSASPLGSVDRGP